MITGDDYIGSRQSQHSSSYIITRQGKKKKSVVPSTCDCYLTALSNFQGRQGGKSTSILRDNKPKLNGRPHAPSSGTTYRSRQRGQIFVQSNLFSHIIAKASEVGHPFILLWYTSTLIFALFRSMQTWDKRLLRCWLNWLKWLSVSSVSVFMFREPLMDNSKCITLTDCRVQFYVFVWNDRFFFFYLYLCCSISLQFRHKLKR